MTPFDPDRAALLVIDVQQGFAEQDAAGRRRNNPDALDKIVELLTVFRRASRPIFHIRHSSTEPDSVFRPDRPGYRAIAVAHELPGATGIAKPVNSGFLATDLDARLTHTGLRT